MIHHNHREAPEAGAAVLLLRLPVLCGPALRESCGLRLAFSRAREVKVSLPVMKVSFAVGMASLPLGKASLAVGKVSFGVHGVM